MLSNSREPSPPPPPPPREESNRSQSNASSETSPPPPPVPRRIPGHSDRTSSNFTSSGRNDSLLSSLSSNRSSDSHTMTSLSQNTQSNASKRILPYRTTEIIDPASSSSTSSIASSFSTLDSDSSGDAIVSRQQHQRVNLDPLPLETQRAPSPKLVPPVKPKPKPAPPAKPTKPRTGSHTNDRGVASHSGSGSPSSRPPALLPKPTKPKPSGVKPSGGAGTMSKLGGEPLVISTVSSPFAKTLEAKLSGSGVGGVNSGVGGVNSGVGGVSSNVGGWDSRGRRPPMPPPKPRT